MANMVNMILKTLCPLSINPKFSYILQRYLTAGCVLCFSFGAKSIHVIRDSSIDRMVKKKRNSPTQLCFSPSVRCTLIKSQAFHFKAFVV